MPCQRFRYTPPRIHAAVLLYWHQLASFTLAAELLLYLAGALAFLRNGGHDRWAGGPLWWDRREVGNAAAPPQPQQLSKKA